MIPLEKCTKSDLIRIIKTCESAVEKQIPKKPKYESYKSDMPKCPSCGEWIQNNATIQKYCNFCGQAIKWRSDTE